MKIFVSYARRDAGDFADQIQRYFSDFEYNVFTDVDSINVGDIWSNIIEDNISKCDFFIVIITYGALQSPHVKSEVIQAQKNHKKIIPCLQRDINYEEIKWGLDNIQGIEFDDKYDLARKLYLKITKSQQKQAGKVNSIGLISSEHSKSKEEFFDSSSLKEKEEQSNNATIPKFKDNFHGISINKPSKRLIKIMTLVIVGIVVIVGYTYISSVFYKPTLFSSNVTFPGPTTFHATSSNQISNTSNQSITGHVH